MEVTEARLAHLNHADMNAIMCIPPFQLSQTGPNEIDSGVRRSGLGLRFLLDYRLSLGQPLDWFPGPRAGRLPQSKGCRSMIASSRSGPVETTCTGASTSDSMQSRKAPLAFAGERLVSRGYTDTEKALAANWTPGDVVAFHRPQNVPRRRERRRAAGGRCRSQEPHGEARGRRRRRLAVEVGPDRGAEKTAEEKPIEHDLGL